MKKHDSAPILAFFSSRSEVNCALSVGADVDWNLARIHTGQERPTIRSDRSFTYIMSFFTRFWHDFHRTQSHLLPALIKEALLHSLSLSLSRLLFSSFFTFARAALQVECRVEWTNKRERERGREREREIRGKRFRNLAALVRQGAKSLFSMWLLQKDRALPVGNINFRSTSFLFFFSLLSFFIFIRLSFLTFWRWNSFPVSRSNFSSRCIVRHCNFGVKAWFTAFRVDPLFADVLMALYRLGRSWFYGGLLEILSTSLLQVSRRTGKIIT